MSAKENGLSICRLPGHDDARKATQILLFDRLQTISGVPMPKGEDYFIVAAEVYSFLLSTPAFRLFTLDEIVTAFRLNASGQMGERVEHYNAIINCDYVGKVLEKYSKIRQGLEDKISHISEPLLIENEPITDYDELIETVKNIFLKTNLAGLIPVSVYEILHDRKEIELDNEEKLKIRKQVEARFYDEAYLRGLIAIKEYKALKENTLKYENFIRNECKKQAVANYFTLQNNIDKF